MRKIILIVSLLFVTLTFIGLKLYNKPHRSVADEESIPISASQLFVDFEQDESVANQKYLDHVVDVTGVVSETLTNQQGQTVVFLKSENPMFGIQCTLESHSIGVSPGSTITVKGICTGYLSDVVITKGILINTSKK